MPDSQNTNSSHSKNTAERVQFETIVHYAPADDHTCSGHCGDLSVGGIYLKTDDTFDTDETIHLSFSLPAEDDIKPISCDARVAWTNYLSNRRKPGYPAGVGLQFLNLSETETSTLEKFIDAYDDNKKMNVLCAWCGSSLGLRKGPIGVTSHGLCDECREKIDL